MGDNIGNFLMRPITEGGEVETLAARSFPYFLDNTEINDSKLISVSSALSTKVVSICVPAYPGLNS